MADGKTEHFNDEKAGQNNQDDISIYKAVQAMYMFYFL